MEPAAISAALRMGIRSGSIACPRECLHGWPRIEHVQNCPWQTAIEHIYRIERELEGIS